MKRSARSTSLFALAAAILLVIVPLSAGVAFGEEAPASGESHPEIIRGFNTFGDRLTPAGADEVRNEYGANAVRLQLDPHRYARELGVSLERAWDMSVDMTVDGLEAAARNGMVAVIDLHTVPIAGDKNSRAFWSDPASLAAIIECWEELVQVLEPYREFIWGYDLLNEPYDSATLPRGAAVWPAWAQEITDVIRVSDPTTSIIFQPTPGALPISFHETERLAASTGFPAGTRGFPLLKDDNVIYSLHWYELHTYTHQGLEHHWRKPVTTSWPDRMVYPGTNRGVYWNKSTLRNLMQPVVDIQKKYGVPIYVGEFSAIRWAPGAARYLRDSIDLFEEFGWSWTYHSYQDWHGWQLDYTSTMTSDENSASAIATQPTDREIVLTSFFARNSYVSPRGHPTPTPSPTTAPGPTSSRNPRNDTTPPRVTIKPGATDTVGSAGRYSVVSFKLFDSGKIDRIELNGTVKDVSNSEWSDLNGVRVGAHGAVRGANTLIVYDVAGNARSVAFALIG